MAANPDSDLASVAQAGARAQAQAAQVPLQNFTLPAFPPEASALRSLTLTCDIKLPEYQALVTSPPSSPPLADPRFALPNSITDLTLELFSLGFPSGFLANLASALPNLKSLTIFSSLIDGLTPETRRDAEFFFRSILARQEQCRLRELHLLDTFTRSGLHRIIAEAAGSNDADDKPPVLQYLEMSYTDRSSGDETFHQRIPAGELVALAGVSSLVALSLTLTPPMPNVTPEKDSTTNLNNAGGDQASEGICPVPFTSRATASIVTAFCTPQPRQLKMLDLTLYTLRVRQVGDVVAANGGIAILSISVAIDEDGGSGEELGSFHQRLREDLGRAAPMLEVLEVVAVPGKALLDKVSEFVQYTDILQSLSCSTYHVPMSLYCCSTRSIPNLYMTCSSTKSSLTPFSSFPIY